MQQETLRSCPFCGDNHPFVERADFSACFVQCNNCLARGPESLQESDEEETPGEAAAIAAWNTRADSHRIAELEAQLAAERKLGDEMAEALKLFQRLDVNKHSHASLKQWVIVLQRKQKEALAHYSEERAGKNSKSSAGQFNIENQVK